MASHRSAQKRARQTVRRTARNTHIKTGTKTAVKRFRQAVQGGDETQAKEALERACRTLRKAASSGVLHARTASRRVGRLAAAQHRAFAAARAPSAS